MDGERFKIVIAILWGLISLGTLGYMAYIDIFMFPIEKGKKEKDK